MGVKQGFGRACLPGADVDLADAWAAADGEPVVVFDGSNLLMQLQTHPQFGLASATVPRLVEYERVLWALLTAVLHQCPDAVLHFVVDGVGRDAVLACKEKEQAARTARSVAEKLEQAATFCAHGCARGAFSSNTATLMQVLCRVLKSLGDCHRVYQAHCAGLDGDVATALHARAHRARLLVSEDSDFAVLCDCTVVKRLRIDGAGRVRGCATNLADRLQMFGLGSRDELLLMAFLAGTDFNPAIMEIGEHTTWQDVALRAKAQLTSRAEWRQAVRQLPCGDAFVQNFDVESYQPHVLTAATEAWTAPNGAVAMGLTRCHPPTRDLDPLLASFGDWLPEVPPSSDPLVPLSPGRLLTAYARGCLSAPTLNVLRCRRCTMSVGLSSIAEGEPFRVHFFGWLCRLASFLAGPVPTGRNSTSKASKASHCHPDPAFFDSIVFEDHDDSLLFHLRSAAADAAWAATEARALHFWAEGTREAQERARLEQHAREARAWMAEQLSVMDRQRLRSLQRRPEAELQAALAGATVAAAGEARSTSEARAGSFFYLATGQPLSQLSKAGRRLVVDCVVSPPARAEDRRSARLFLTALCAACRGLLLPEHVEQLRVSLGLEWHPDFEVSCPDLALPGPSPDRRRVAARALLLGELCWSMLAILQDSFCLCGGEGLLFPEGVPLDGGPVVVVQDGEVRQGRGGYRVSILHDPAEVLPDSVVSSVMQRCFNWPYFTGQVQHMGTWLQVTGVSACEAFWYHRRVVFVDFVPYKLNVRALDGTGKGQVLARTAPQKLP